MSSYNPKGVKVEIGGEERHFLFDYNVIAEIQEKYDSSVIQVLIRAMQTNGVQEINASIFISLVHILLEGERERMAFYKAKGALKGYSKKELGFVLDKDNGQAIFDAILEAWHVSIPKPTEEDLEEADAERELAEAEGRDPNVESGRGTSSTSPARS